MDACGVCNGDGSSCADCAGTPNGNAVVDACGVCNGDGSSCAGCDGQPNSGLVNDECGVCGGPGIASGACDCDGHVNDACGVCGGDGSTCSDECGVPNGDNSTCSDICGVPNGDGTSCLGCDGQPNSGLVNDECGVCGGPGIASDACDCDGNVADCTGRCGGSAVVEMGSSGGNAIMGDGNCISFNGTWQIMTPADWNGNLNVLVDQGQNVKSVQTLLSNLDGNQMGYTPVGNNPTSCIPLNGTYDNIMETTDIIQRDINWTTGREQYKINNKYSGCFRTTPECYNVQNLGFLNTGS